MSPSNTKKVVGVNKISNKVLKTFHLILIDFTSFCEIIKNLKYWASKILLFFFQQKKHFKLFRIILQMKRKFQNIK